MNTENTTNTPRAAAPAHTPVLCIYQPGALHPQTTVSIGPDGTQWADYTAYDHPGKRNYTAEGYLTKLNAKRAPGSPEFAVMPWAEAEKLATAARVAKYCGPWQEVTEERYYELLNVLPPQKWQTVRGVNLFRLCEYTIDNITLHVAKLDGRYFTAERQTSTAYEYLAAEVAEVARTTMLEHTP